MRENTCLKRKTETFRTNEIRIEVGFDYIGVSS